MKQAIGIDIGGTKIAIGVVNEAGQVQAKLSIPTDPNLEPDKMMDRISTNIDELLRIQNVNIDAISGIGIGAPGPLNPDAGELTCPPNLPRWWGFPVVPALRQRFPLMQIRMENDATAAALAEKWVGTAQPCEHFIYLTISTGIGAGLYLHGRLATGVSGNAGDAGHIVIDPAAGRCRCGQLGCWEWVASGTAIARLAEEAYGRPVSPKQLFERAADQESIALELTDRIYRYIGMGCVSLINLLDPEMIVIGGGVSQAGPRLFNAVRDYVSQHALNPAGRQTRIVASQLSQDTGLIGAAALIHAANHMNG